MNPNPQQLVFETREEARVCKHCHASYIFKQMITTACEAKNYLERCEFIAEPKCKHCGHGITSHVSNGCNVGLCHGRFPHQFTQWLSEEKVIIKEDNKLYNPKIDGKRFIKANGMEIKDGRLGLIIKDEVKE